MTREELRANRQKYVEKVYKEIDDEILHQDVLGKEYELMTRQAYRGLFIEELDSEAARNLINDYRGQNIALLLNKINQEKYDEDLVKARLVSLYMYRNHGAPIIIRYVDEGVVREIKQTLAFSDGNFVSALDLNHNGNNLVIGIENAETGEKLFDISEIKQTKSSQNQQSLDVGISRMEQDVKSCERWMKELGNRREQVETTIDRAIEIGEKYLYERRLSTWMSRVQDLILNEHYDMNKINGMFDVIERLENGERPNKSMYESLGVNILDENRGFNMLLRDVAVFAKNHGVEFLRAQYLTLSDPKEIDAIEQEMAKPLEEKNAELAAEETAKYQDMRDVELKTIDPENVKDLANVGDGKGE